MNQEHSIKVKDVIKDYCPERPITPPSLPPTHIAGYDTPTRTTSLLPNNFKTPILSPKPIHAKEKYASFIVEESYFPKNPDPLYYHVGSIEAIDYIKAKLTKEQFKGFLRGNIIKYMSRAGYKSNGDPIKYESEDYIKAKYYMDLLASKNLFD